MAKFATMLFYEKKILILVSILAITHGMFSLT